MKNIMRILMVLILSFSIASCGNENVKVDNPEGNKDVQNPIVEDKEESKETGKDNADEEKNKEEADNKANEEAIKKFMVTGEYDTKSSSNDLGVTIDNIKGNKESYQEIGYTGKGKYISVYKLDGASIKRVYFGDLDEDEKYKDEEYKDEVILKAPLVVGTRWDNKEIVEVGENLKLENITLEGKYVKVWEKKKDGKDEEIKVSYFSEGLGCVKYKIILNDVVIGYFEYEEINKK